MPGDLPSSDSPQAEAKETGRVEAFSDGLFAVAITLLAFNLTVPHPGESPSLLAALVNQWPVYVGFLISFATIGVMWINHHVLFTHIQRVDRTLLALNGLLLMWIALVPFTTLLLAEYIQRPLDQTVAGLIYTGQFVIISIFYNLLWRYVSYKNRLLSQNADPAAVAAITRQYRFGPLMYLIAVGVTLVNVIAALALCMGMAVFFALPGKRSDPSIKESP